MAKSILGGDGILSRRTFLRRALVAGSATLLAIQPNFRLRAATTLTWGAVVETVKLQLATRHGYLPGDLITRGDVEPVFKKLHTLGWDVADREQLLKLVLEDGHFLAKQLRSAPGLKFARGVAREQLVFDRLDRLSNMPGGERLIHDMIRLPNGQSFMARRPTPGFTDLTILLPKQANGKTPRDKDFNKPTGKIYTESDLVKALEKSWQARKV